jgi:hypothetical protein
MLFTLLASTLVAGAAMAADPPSSAWQAELESLRFVLLDTPDKASDLVETLVRIRHGREEAEEERPFVAAQHGDAWIVRGSRLGRHVMPLPSRSVVTVRKADGAILEWTYLGPELPKALKERARKL